MSIVSAYMTMLEPKFVVTALILNMFSTFIVLSIINPYPVADEPELKLNKLHEDQSFFEMLGEYILAGFKIAMIIAAMLIGFIALIALVDWSLLKIGHIFSANLDLSLNYIFSKLFYPMAWAMGIPTVDIQNAATLLGQKLTINEFVAFKSLTSKVIPIVTEKGLLIVSIAICGFANFSSVGMLIGGIGELAPSRRKDLAELGLKALLAGTLASYLSACIAGILM